MIRIIWSGFPPTVSPAPFSLPYPPRASPASEWIGEARCFARAIPVFAIFVVESGYIRLARIQAEGTALVLHIADDGDSFAEAALSATQYHCPAEGRPACCSGRRFRQVRLPGAGLGLPGARPAPSVGAANVRPASERVLA
jgi:hypothetical protein